MSAEQSLVGAMGLASWRVRDLLIEYASLAPASGAVRTVGKRLTISPSSPLGLNEVGVTDAVMATLWRFGPHAAAYATSPAAESGHLGADIVVVHAATKRVLLYQAKLATCDGVDFNLKSGLKMSQARRLQRKTVDLAGKRFRVSGRLALYQCDWAPFIGACAWAPWHLPLPFYRSVPVQADPTVGREYYKDVLSLCGCSPSGVLAAVAPSAAVTSVAARDTWPWEYDLYEWLAQRTGRLDTPPYSPGSDDRPIGDQAPPDFEPYEPSVSEPIDAGDVVEMATQLAGQMRLPVGHVLYLIHI